MLSTHAAHALRIFLIAIGRECANAPAEVAYVGSRLFNLEALVRRADEAFCNEVASDARMAERDEHVRRAERLASMLGATLVHNADPRGLTFELHFQSGRTLGV